MSERSNLLYLQDIEESIEAIESYVESLAFDEFRSDRKTYSATIREFEIIGEAVGKILEDDRIRAYSHIPWREIKDFRNLLIHAYFGVDAEIVWNTIQQDLPELKAAVVEILQKEKEK